MNKSLKQSYKQEMFFIFAVLFIIVGIFNFAYFKKGSIIPEPSVNDAVVLYFNADVSVEGYGAPLNIPCKAEGNFCQEILNGTFNPVDKNTVCTEIYGGPEEARIVGEIGKKEVDLVFHRNNGCEIDRWNILQEHLSKLISPINLPVWSEE